MERGRRSYQVCGHAGCRNWIWDDQVREGCVCRQCGSAWTQPLQGYAPTTGGGSTKVSLHLQDCGMAMARPRRSRSRRGTCFCPPQKLAGHHTTREAQGAGHLSTPGGHSNLSQLPAPVKELLERITKPQPPTEKDVAIKLKQQVSTLRDLSHRKQTLQTKIDATKKAFQDLLDEMKAIQSKIEQEQAELNATSTAYMSLVSKQPDPVQLSEDADMKDPVPEAVAGFISTLGVNLTQAQHDQLKTMLKRPPATNEEDSKRRKTGDEEKDQSCG